MPTRKGWLTLLGWAGIILLLSVPTVTRQGINYQVTEKRIPLVSKAAGFLRRDLQYRHLSAKITRQARSPQERALALLVWTHENIRPTPKGLPVIDDHVASILDRGYGQPDQIADVFTTLAAYSDLPGFWKQVRTPDRPQGLILSFLKIENQWTVWDAAAGKSYDPALLTKEDFSQPKVLRPYKQMPVPRLLIELRQRIQRRSSA